MAAHISCCQCKEPLAVEANAVANKVRCPACGMIQSITRPTEALSSSDDQVPPVSDPPPGHMEGASQSHPDLMSTVYRPKSSSGGPLDLPLTTSFQPDRQEVSQRWLVQTPDGSIYGPADSRELDLWVQQGRLSAQCLLKAEQGGYWESALTRFPVLSGLKPAKLSQKSPATSPTRSGSASGAPRVAAEWNTTDDSSRHSRGPWICGLALFGILLPMLPIFSATALAWALFERDAVRQGKVVVRNRLERFTLKCGVVLSTMGVMYVLILILFRWI